MTGADEFVESGRIAFGEDSGHALLFSTVGLGHIIAGPADGIMTGTASWIIEGGEGQFRAARGLINSTFTIDDAGQRSDFQCGLIFLPDSQPVDEAPSILDAARDSASRPAHPKIEAMLGATVRFRFRRGTEAANAYGRFGFHDDEKLSIASRHRCRGAGRRRDTLRIRRRARCG